MQAVLPAQLWMELRLQKLFLKNTEIFRGEYTSFRFMLEYRLQFARKLSESIGQCYEKHYKDLPEDQRPYEKCFYQGEDTLSDSELLAVILRSGTREQNSLSLAQTVLQYMEKSSYSGLMGLLHISVEDLMKIHGIGRVKAVQLKCIGELSKRIATTAARSQLSLNSPGSIAAYYMEQLRHEEQELVICMMVDVKGHFLGDKILSRGTATSRW